MSWCITNNTSLFQFNKTPNNLNALCEFIGKKYKTKTLLDGIDCTEKLLVRVGRASKKTKDMTYLIKNLRMTICELG